MAALPGPRPLGGSPLSLARSQKLRGSLNPWRSRPTSFASGAWCGRSGTSIIICSGEQWAISHELYAICFETKMILLDSQELTPEVGGSARPTTAVFKAYSLQPIACSQPRKCRWPEKASLSLWVTTLCGTRMPLFMSSMCARFYDSDGDGIGDFRGLTAEARLSCRTWAITAIWLLPFYPSPLQGRRLRYRRLYRHSSALRHAAGFQGASCARPRPGLAGDHRTGAQPHFRPASLVSAGPARRAGQPWRDFYVWSDTPEKYPGRPDHLQGFRNLQLGLGPGGQGLLLAPLLFPSARPELRQPGGARGDVAGRRFLARAWESTACGWTPFPTSSSGKAPTARTCPRPTHFLKSSGATSTRNFQDRMLLAEANQWPEDAVGLLRRGR